MNDQAKKQAMRLNIEITDSNGARSFIKVRDNGVWYVSASGQSLALSNIAREHAAELEMALDAIASMGATQNGPWPLAREACEKYLPRYLSGPKAGQHFFMFQQWKP